PRLARYRETHQSRDGGEAVATSKQLELEDDSSERVSDRESVYLRHRKGSASSYKYLEHGKNIEKLVQLNRRCAVERREFAESIAPPGQEGWREAPGWWFNQMIV